MSWNQVLETLGAGAAGSIMAAGWTKQAGVADWARNGSGLIVPGETYATNIRRTTEMPSADMAVEAVLNAATGSELNHTLIVRSNAAINNDAQFDRINLAAGPELWFNGSYVTGYGDLGWAFTAHPTLRVEAQGTDYRVYINGVLRRTLTARLAGGAGSNHAGFRGRSVDEFQALRVYEWADEPAPTDDGMHVGLLLTPP